MKNRFLLFLLCGFLAFFSCSDGDIITVELDFDDTFEGCEESDLLFYKTKEEPAESLSLLFTSFNYEDIFVKSEDSLRFIGDTLTFEGEPATFNYRTYNRTDLPPDLFCTLVPPANLNIVIDQSDDVNVTITRILTEDDNDGVPSELEGPLDPTTGNYIDPLGDDDDDGVYNFLDDEPNNKEVGDADGKIEDGFDTDGDGLPNFIDEDDDGDNVLTKNENPDPNDDGDLSDAQNTDADLFDAGNTDVVKDDIPDYLDPDDDGDGVLTINEETDTQDQNPLNDFTFDEADFLNPNATTFTEATAYRQHKINMQFIIRAVVKDISLEFLSQQVLDFGTLSDTNSAETEFSLTQTRTATPIFP